MLSAPPLPRRETSWYWTSSILWVSVSWLPEARDGDDPHAAVLVADVAVGDVGIVVLVVAEVVGIQVLVAAAQDDVALVVQVLLGAAKLVALDGRRLLGAICPGLGGVAAWFVAGAAIEGGNGVLYRAQIPVVGFIVRSEGRQAQGDGERQR